MIEGHGDDLYRYGDTINHNFSSNIFQGVDHSALKAHLAQCMDIMSNYPEPAPFSVEKIVAKKFDIPAECIMVTNGAVDAIHTIARAYQEKCSAILQPTFSEYADACRISGHTVKSFYHINSVPVRPDMIWICNPNNPTGRVYTRDEMLSLVGDNPDATIVVDQAYHKYTDLEVLPPDEVIRHRNLILLYSMTKDFAIPGLRLGMIVANRGVIKSLKSYRVPWSVNSFAIEAANFLLTHHTVDIDIPALLAEARRVSCDLEREGIAVSPSDTNFMLCRLPQGEASDLKSYLAENHGILIRDASNFEGLTSRHFRIAVQRPDENDLLINAIKLWMHS